MNVTRDEAPLLSYESNCIQFTRKLDGRLKFSFLLTNNLYYTLIIEIQMKIHIYTLKLYLKVNALDSALLNRLGTSFVKVRFASVSE